MRDRIAEIIWKKEGVYYDKYQYYLDKKSTKHLADLILSEIIKEVEGLKDAVGMTDAYRVPYSLREVYIWNACLDEVVSKLTGVHPPIKRLGGK